MTTTEIRERLDRDPFKPFRVQLSSGKHYDIRDPLSVAVMRNRLFVTLPDGERWVFVPYLHIAAVEALPPATARLGAGDDNGQVMRSCLELGNARWSLVRESFLEPRPTGIPSRGSRRTPRRNYRMLYARPPSEPLNRRALRQARLLTNPHADYNLSKAMDAMTLRGINFDESKIAAFCRLRRRHHANADRAAPDPHRGHERGRMCRWSGRASVRESADSLTRGKGRAVSPPQPYTTLAAWSCLVV